MGFPEAKWIVDQIVSKLAVQPGNMRMLRAAPTGNAQVALRFTEPENAYYRGGEAIAADVEGTMIRVSTEGYPQTPSDGTLVVDNKDLGAYSDTDYVVNGLASGVPAYFSAFPYTSKGVYNESLDDANKATATPVASEAVSVVINVSDTVAFTGTSVTLKNVNTQETVVKNVTGPGTVQFDAEQGNTFVVQVQPVASYSTDKLQSEQFTAVAGGTRTITFTYTYGFLYSITFDNGADGIPSSFEYGDDATGFTPASGSNMGSWAGSPLLDKFKPCLIKPGASAPEYYLNKDNYNLRADGSTASVLTGADGDVMVEVEKLWYKVEKDTVAKTIKLSIATAPLDGFACFNEVAGVIKDKVYRGVYEATDEKVAGTTWQMRSVSGKRPLVGGNTRADFRELARTRGNEYSLNDYYLVMLWQCMYIMLYGTRDSQTALGQGRTKSDNTGVIDTGTMNDKPFCWGDAGGVNGVKFLGVENFYGNLREFVDGITIINKIVKVTRDPSKYDDNGESYETTVITYGGAISAHSTEMVGINDGIFVPAPNATTGSGTTYYCDGLWVNGSAGVRVAMFGGSWSEGTMGGAFFWSFYAGSGATDSNVGSRLCRVGI